MDYSDEILMAFADGELDEAQAQEVARAVAADPALSARVAMFRRSREMMRDAFAQDQAKGAQDPLAAMIRAAGRDAAAPPAAAAPVAPPAPANMNWRPMAVAASLALALLGAGWLAMPQRGGDGGQTVILRSDIRAALSRVTSGETEQLDGYDFTAIASFRNREGELCREYETRTPQRVQLGVACHDGASWQSRFAALSEGGGEDYMPASGEVAGLDDYIARAGMSEPLTIEDEDAALAQLP